MGIDYTEKGLLVDKKVIDRETGLVKIELSPQGVILSTAKHRIYVLINRHPNAPCWVVAGRVEAGDRILCVSGWPVND